MMVGEVPAGADNRFAAPISTEKKPGSLAWLARLLIKASVKGRMVGQKAPREPLQPDHQPRLHFVVDVAREAAARRFPLPTEDGTDAWTLALGWQEWAVERLLRQVRGYAYDRKIEVFLTDSAKAATHDPLPVPQEQWRVDSPGRESLASLFNDDPVEIQPTFDVPPRVLVVPAVLDLLPQETSVRVRYPWHQKRELDMPAREAARALRDTMKRQAEGWLVIAEAAQLLMEAGRGSAHVWRDKLKAAARSDQLPMHESESLDRVIYGHMGQSVGSRQVSSTNDWVHVDDLNGWLDRHEPRLPFRFERHVATRSPRLPLPLPISQCGPTDAPGVAVEYDPDIEAPQEQCWILGRRLWRISDAVAFVAAIEGSGIRSDDLLERAVRAASARPPGLTFRSITDGSKKLGDQLSGFLNDWLFANDFNAWLATEAIPEPYRVAEVQVEGHLPRSVVVDSAQKRGPPIEVLELWTVIRPQRSDALRAALAQFLDAADKTRPRPTAREVLTAWQAARPMDITRVMTDSVEYLDANGDSRTADLDSISERLTRLTATVPR